MTHYDLLVLGSGSGNAIIDSDFQDWSVAIVEEGRFGGTCLNRGCIPSKMYVVPAQMALSAGRGPDFGLRTTFDGVDWPALRRRILGVTDEHSADGRQYRVDQPWVDVHAGTARFTGPRTVHVDLLDGGSVELSADHVVVATGSRPVLPDIPGLDDVEVHTSDTIMRLETMPARLGVVGGGYVGAEFAHVFSGLGAEVVQVDAAETLLSNHDDDVAALFTREVSRRWDVRLGAGLDEVERLDDGAARLHLSDGSTADVDVVLMAVGRTPNNDRLDLELTGVEVDEDGLVVVDEHQRTTAPGVWSLGDASSDQPLKHAANQDARVVSHNLTHPDDLIASRHGHVPSAVFTSPQIASIGLTETQAREQGLDLAVASTEYADTAHGWALEEAEGGHFVKLLADRATGLLVGAHLIGPEASILVQTLIHAMSHEQPVAGLARSMYWIHPSLTEVVEQALLALEAELGGAS